MKRTVILVLALALALAACQGQPQPTAEPTAAIQTTILPPADGSAYPYPQPDASGADTSAYPLPEGFETAEQISWEAAQQLLMDGQVSEIFQTRALDLLLTLKDGTQKRTTEPSLDEIFNVMRLCGEPCAPIVVTTE